MPIQQSSSREREFEVKVRISTTQETWQIIARSSMDALQQAIRLFAQQYTAVPPTSFVVRPVRPCNSIRKGLHGLHC